MQNSEVRWVKKDEVVESNILRCIVFIIPSDDVMLMMMRGNKLVNKLIPTFQLDINGFRPLYSMNNPRYLTRQDWPMVDLSVRSSCPVSQLCLFVFKILAYNVHSLPKDLISHFWFTAWKRKLTCLRLDFMNSIYPSIVEQDHQQGEQWGRRSKQMNKLIALIPVPWTSVFPSIPILFSIYNLPFHLLVCRRANQRTYTKIINSGIPQV